MSGFLWWEFAAAFIDTECWCCSNKPPHALLQLLDAVLWTFSRQFKVCFEVITVACVVTVRATTRESLAGTLYWPGAGGADCCKNLQVS